MRRSVALPCLAPLFFSGVSFAQVPDVEALRTAGVINVGVFCLTEIPRGAIKVGQAKFLDDGTWYPVAIEVKAGPGAKPNAYFFRSAPKPAADGRPRSCSATQNEALVKGRVNSSTIQALFKPRVSDTEKAQWYIGQNDLNAEFGQTAEA